MDDLTEVAPVRRLAVARGTLAAMPLDPDHAGALAAASLAVKQASSIFSDEHAFHATHVDVLIDDAVTVTVQGFARHELGRAALLGTAAALIHLGGAAAVVTMQIVQSH